MILQYTRTGTNITINLCIETSTRYYYTKFRQWKVFYTCVLLYKLRKHPTNILSVLCYLFIKQTWPNCVGTGIYDLTRKWPFSCKASVYVVTRKAILLWSSQSVQVNQWSTSETANYLVKNENYLILNVANPILTVVTMGGERVSGQ